MPDIKRLDVTKPCFMLESPDGHYIAYTDHIAALEAVKVTADEPVAWMWHDSHSNNTCYHEYEPTPDVYVSDVTPLYTRPPLEANQQVIDGLKAEHRAQMADMSERFREVNVTEALRQMGNDKQVIETLRAERDAALLRVKTTQDILFNGAFPEIEKLRAALSDAADQLSRAHDDSFKQAAGYGLLTSDGRDFSCYELNRCQTAAGKARAALSDNPKGEPNAK